ncbi:MAG: metallopeptidase family protein [bacterium]|nr:metallopeptidase family protein [bacterium]
MIELSREEFEKLVDEGIAAIPRRFLDKLDNVAVTVEGNPSDQQKRKAKLGKNYTLFGLYEGVPQTGRWNYNLVLPDKITIFRHPIEEAAGSVEEIKNIVRDTVWHEIAHHFGMNEERVRRAETRRSKSAI